MAMDIKIDTTQYASGVGSGLSRGAPPLNTSKVGEKTDANDFAKVAKLDKEEAKEDKSVNDLVDKAVTSLNSSIQSVQRNLQFSVDKDLDRIIINVTDKETDEVVRQIPSEDVLDLARNLQDMVENRKSGSKGSNEGVFFSSTA